MTSEEIRVARIALGWSQADLAERAHVGMRTVRRIEAGEEPTAVVANAVQTVLREAGVVTFRETSEVAGLDIRFGVAVLKRSAAGTSSG